MSGGSWDYAYRRVEEIAERMCAEKCPYRQAFGGHLELVAKALHDIEWVDSGDYGDGKEIAAIMKVLNK